jgi:hypothetical protein
LPPNAYYGTITWYVPPSRVLSNKVPEALPTTRGQNKTKTATTFLVEGKEEAIRDNKPTDMHPNMYNAVIDILGVAADDLMAALSHLVDHKA